MIKLLSWYVLIICSIIVFFSIFYFTAQNLRGNDFEVMCGVISLVFAGIFLLAVSGFIGKEISNWLKKKGDQNDDV